MEYNKAPAVIKTYSGEIENQFFNGEKLISGNQKIISKNLLVKRNSYTTFGAGTFIRGRWNPFPFEKCIAWKGCFKRLEGINVFGSYTKEIFRKGVWSFDIDFTGMVGNQSSNQNFLYEEIENSSGIFGVVGIIPGLRIKKLGHKIPIGIGLGIGPSYSFGTRVVEKPYDFSGLLSQVNAEINIPISQNQNTSLVFGLSHVCTFLGIVDNNEGQGFGHHWYSVGIRRKM